MFFVTFVFDDFSSEHWFKLSDSLLVQSVIGVAVVVLSWVWDTNGFAIKKGHSLVEVWAVLEDGNVGCDVLLL